MSALRWARWALVVAWYEVKSWWWWASYAIRPYDMLADRRRWAWQPAQRCGGSILAEDLSPEDIRTIAEALGVTEGDH